MMKYRGFEPKSAATAVEVRGESGSLNNTEGFFREFVRERKPVKITGQAAKEVAQGNGFGFHKWSFDYLKTTAGEEIVQVERRLDANETFGLGKKVEEKFGVLLSKMERGDQSFYMTTQHIQVDEDGAPLCLFGKPLNKLKQDFPLRPKLFGHLVPHQMNLWVGNAKDGSSSGLHHDFHDNLYVLLRGKKRFTLFPPSCTPSMYTYGQLVQVHENGLINYTSCVTRADGAHEAIVARYRKQTQGSEEGAKRKVAGNQSAGRKKSKAEVEESEVDEEEEDEEQGFAIGGGLDSEDDFSIDLNNLRDDYDDGEEDEESDTEEKKEPTNPQNFSRINLYAKNPFAEYPLAQTNNIERVKMVVELSAGDMLYLPASWFHEVTSFSAPGEQGHMAFNYWMHPPCTSSFEQPYVDSYWEDVYKDQEQNTLATV